jgi:hypothetical protein
MSRVLYGGETTEDIAELLEDAMSRYTETDKAEAKLVEALRRSPKSLPVHFSLYKFYFYKKRLVDADKVVQNSLLEAAHQGGFDPDWKSLNSSSTDWSNTPAHFYLFSLKALAFIRLRQGDETGCLAVLNKLLELDQGDKVGASVISDIAKGAHGYSKSSL